MWIHQSSTFCRLSLTRHNMMQQFQITSGDSIVKEYLRCPCGTEWTLIKRQPSYTHCSPSFPSQVKAECSGAWFALSIIYLIGVYSLFYIPWILVNACHVVTSVISPRIVSPPKNSLHSTPLTPASRDVFTVSIVLLFPECYNVGITHYPAFSHWLLSLSSMHSMH